MYRYLYEITKSEVDTAMVGTFIIDRSNERCGRGEPRAWTLYDKETGDFSDGWTGVCLHRVCVPCFDQDMAREHGHSRCHGEASSEPHLVPRRLATASV